MRPLSEKLLTIFVVLSLALASLQGVLAGSAFAEAQEGGAHQMGGSYIGDVELPVDEKTHDCDQCQVDHCGDDSSCNANLCSSCGLVALPTFVHLTFYSRSSLTKQTEPALISSPVSSPYRPPRA